MFVFLEYSEAFRVASAKRLDCGRLQTSLDAGGYRLLEFLFMYDDSAA